MMSAEQEQPKRLNAEELIEGHKNLKEKIDRLKKREIVMETHLNDLKTATNSDTLVTKVSFSYANFQVVYSYLGEIYEIFDSFLDAFKEIDDELNSLNQELQNHKPTLEFMRQSMEYTKQTLKDGK